MRIFQVLEGSANAAVPGNQTWYRNLYEPLVEMGHDVVLFPATEGRLAMQQNTTRGRAAFSQKLLDAFRREHARKPFAMFFAYLMDGMVDTEAIDEIRKSGVPTCNFSCNNAHQFYLVDELAPHFDYSLHSEKDAGQRFVAIGANPFWWPMASNPKYFKPYDLLRTIAVSFVGGNYALRVRYISHLLENGIDVQVYGPGWGGSTPLWRSIARRYRYLIKTWLAVSPSDQRRASAMLADHDFISGLRARFPNNVHGPITDDEMIALYSRSHISLGFLEVYDRHEPGGKIIQHLHLRDFEAPMCGALYCTGYMRELEEFFEPDKEVLVYRNQHELADKVRYYLAHPQYADKIRQAALRRARECHTYHRRFADLFDRLGLDKAE